MKVGNNYYIQTVGGIYVGRLDEIDIACGLYRFSQMSWVSDAGNVYDFLHDGTIVESIPLDGGDSGVGIGHVLAFSRFNHDLPDGPVGKPE